MPTVTVLAWCLMASTGRVSSSMARVSAAVRSSTTTLGVPTLPYSSWYASSGTTPGGVAQQRGQPHGRARLEVAVVVAARAARRGSGRPPAVEPARRAGRAGLGAVGARSPTTASMAAARLAQRHGPGRRWPAPPRSRTGARPWPTARRPAPGWTAGTAMTCSAAGKRSSPSLAMTTGAALWAR